MRDETDAGHGRAWKSILNFVWMGETLHDDDPILRPFAQYAWTVLARI